MPLKSVEDVKAIRAAHKGDVPVRAPLRSSTFSDRSLSCTVQHTITDVQDNQASPTNSSIEARLVFEPLGTFRPCHGARCK